MNEGMKCGLWFLGGVTLGVLGAVAVSRGKLDFKPLATDLLSRGMGEAWALYLDAVIAGNQPEIPHF